MAGLGTGTPIVQVYHEKSIILPDVSRVLACLYEKDIKFERHTTSYQSLLKLQASTHAPVPFYDGPTFLEESREICRYIAEKYEGHGYPFLLGKDALERASVEQWLHNEEHAFNPPSRALFCHLAFPWDKDDNGDDIDMHIRKLEEVLDIYEQRLSDTEFLAGNKFTLADLVHLPNSHYITSSKNEKYLKLFKLYDSRKNVRRWWDAISTRDSWQHVLMDMKTVEEQNKQVEPKEQQQKQKNDPRTTDYPLQISRMQTTTKPQTVLMHPDGTVLSSPIAHQTEKPLRIDIPEETLISSSSGTHTDNRILVAQSKENPFQEKPLKKSPIPVQSTVAPATSPTTSEKPPIVGAPRLGTKDDSSKDFQQHPSQDSEQATSSPVLQESMSMKLVQGQEKITQRPYTDQRRDVSSPLSQQTGDPQGIAVDDKASSNKSSALLFPSTQKQAGTPSRRATAEVHSTFPPQARYQDGQGTNKQLGDLDGSPHTTSPFKKRDPLTEDTTKKTKDIISVPGQIADQDTEDTENTIEKTDIPDSSSSQVQPLHFQETGAPSRRQETTKGLFQEKETTEDDHGATLPIHKWPANVEDMDGQYMDDAFKPKQIIGQDDRGIFRETKFGDPSLLGEQPSDTRQPPTTADEETNRDGLSVSPPSKRTQTINPSVTASRMRYPSAKDAIKQPRGNASTPMCKAAQDSEGSTIADEVASTKQRSNAQDAPISPRRQEVEDSPGAITSLQKRHPYVEDMQNAETASRRIAPSGVKDTFEERKIADSSQTSAKPIYTQQPTLHPQRQFEVQHDQEKGRQSEVRIPKQQKVVSRDALYKHGERKLSAYTPSRSKTPDDHSADAEKLAPSLLSKEEARDEGRQSSKAIPQQQMGEQETGTSGGQLSEHHASVQAAPEDARGPTHGAIEAQDNLHTTKEPRGTFEESKTPGPTLPNAQSFGAQDVQYTNGESIKPTSEQRKDVSTKPLRSGQDVFKPSKISGTDHKDLGSLSSEGKVEKKAESIMAEKEIFSTERLREMLKESESTTLNTQPSDSGGSTKANKTSSIYQKPLTTQDSHEQTQIIPASEKADGSTLKHQQSSDAPYTLDDKFSSSAPKSADIHDDPRKEVSYRKDTTANQKVAPPLLSQKPTSHGLPPSDPYHDAAPHEELSSSKSIIEQWQRANAPLNGTSTDSDHNKMDISSNIKEKPMLMSQEAPLSSQRVNQIAQQSGEQTVEPAVQIGTETSGVQHAAPSLPEAATKDHAIIDDKFVKQPIIKGKLGEPKQTQAPVTDARPASPPTKGKTPDGHEPGDLEIAASSEGQILDATNAVAPNPATIRKDSHDAAIDEKTATYDANDSQLVTGSLPEQAPPPAPIHETMELIHGQTSEEPQLGGSSQAEVAQAEHKSTPSDKKPARAMEPFSPDEPVTADSDDSAQTIFRQQTRPSASLVRGVPSSESQNVAWKIQEVTPDNHRTGDSAMPLVPGQEDEISHTSQAIPRQEDTTYSPSARDSLKSNYQSRSAQVHEVTPYESSEKQGSHTRSTFGPNELGPSEKNFAPSDQGLGQSAEEPSSAKRRQEQPIVPTAEQNKTLPRVIDEQGTAKMREVPKAEDAPDTISTHGDRYPTTISRPFSVQGAEPTSSPQAPPLHVAHETLHTGTAPDDPFKNVQSMKPSASADAQHGITPRSIADENIPAERKFVPSAQDSVHSKQLIPSALQNNEVIGDSAPETLQIFSTKQRKGDSAVPTHDQAKGTPTSIDQQVILSTPVRSVSQSSDAQRPPEKAQEDEPADALGEFSSRSPSASAPAAQHGAPTDKALDKQKFVPSGQDSVHPKQPSFSSEQRNRRIGDSASPTQWISSTKPRKGDDATAPDKAMDPQITTGRQDILPVVRSVSQSSDIRHSSGKVHDDVRPDDMGEAKPILQTSAPETQDDTASDETGPDEKKIRLSEPALYIDQSNKEIRDSSPSTHLVSSTDTRKSQGDAPSDDSGKASSKPSALIRDVSPSTVVPTSPPVTQHDAAKDETLDKQKFVTSGQDSIHFGLPRTGEIVDSGPSTQQTSTRLRKGGVADFASDQAKDTQINRGPQDILPPVTSVSSSSESQALSGEVHEDLPAADDSEEVKPEASAPDTQDANKFLQSGQISSTNTNKSLEDAPADDLREASSKPSALVREVRPSTLVPTSPPVTQHDAARDETLDEQKFVPSGQDSVHSRLPRPGEIGDSAPSTQQTSTRPRKGDVADSTPDQAKDTQITRGPQDIFPPVTSVSSSSKSQPLSGKVHEDLPAVDNDDSGEVKPQASAPDTQDANKFLPSGQISSTGPKNKEIRDSAPSTHLVSSSDTKKSLEDAPADDSREASSKPSALVREVRPSTVVPTSPPMTPHDPARDETLDKQKFVPSGQDYVHSILPRTGERGDSALSIQQTSTRPRKRDVADSAPDQAKDTQITHGPKDILPPVTSVSSSSESQPLSGKVHDDLPATDDDDSGEVKLQASAPDIQDANKFLPSGQISSTGPKNKEIRDLAPSTHLVSSTDTRNASAADSREASSKPSALVREVRPSTVVPTSPPVTPHDAARDETLDKQKFVPSGQDSVHSRLPRTGEIGDLGPSTQQTSSRLRKGDVADSAPDQAKDTQIIHGPQDILPPVTSVFSSSESQTLSGKVHKDLPAADDDSREVKPEASSPNTQDADKFLPSGTAAVEPPQKTAFDLSGSEKTTATQDDHVNTLLNGDLSSGQLVRPFESTDIKETNSKQEFEGASTYDKSKAHQNDQSNTPSSKGNNKEAIEAIISDLTTPNREQKNQSSWPKESVKSSGESELQKQTDQDIVQSPDNNLKQIERTKIHDTETGEPEERELEPLENTIQTHNKVSRVEALDNLGKQTSGVQLPSEDTKDASNSTDDALDDIQTRSISKDSLRSSEEPKLQQQPAEDKTQGFAENSSQNSSCQFQAEASGKSTEKLSPGIQDENKSSSGLEDPTDSTKPGAAEDKSPDESQ